MSTSPTNDSTGKTYDSPAITYSGVLNDYLVFTMDTAHIESIRLIIIRDNLGDAVEDVKQFSQWTKTTYVIHDGKVVCYSANGSNVEVIRE